MPTLSSKCASHRAPVEHLRQYIRRVGSVPRIQSIPLESRSIHFLESLSSHKIAKEAYLSTLRKLKKISRDSNYEPSFLPSDAATSMLLSVFEDTVKEKMKEEELIAATKKGKAQEILVFNQATGPQPRMIPDDGMEKMRSQNHQHQEGAYPQRDRRPPFSQMPTVYEYLGRPLCTEKLCYGVCHRNLCKYSHRAPARPTPQHSSTLYRPRHWNSEHSQDARGNSSSSSDTNSPKQLSPNTTLVLTPTPSVDDITPEAKLMLPAAASGVPGPLASKEVFT
jgi:hypothetical protein